MMAMVTQLIFLLAVFNLITGSRDVPVLVGRSVQLDIQDTVLTFNVFSWMRNQNSILQFFPKYNDVSPYDPYKDRVEFNKETYSLTLKMVQKTDSGLYEAKISGQNDRTVAKYNLTVFDPVEAPVLSHQKNKITCYITLTCRAHDLSISSSCYNETCEEKIDTTPGGFMLFLSVRGSLVICNHSNPVDWKEDVIDMKIFRQCENTQQSPWTWYTLAGVALIVLVLGIIVGIIWIRKTKSKGEGPIQCENTVYAEVETNAAATPPQSSLEAPSTVYSVVGKKSQPNEGESSQDTENQGPRSTMNTGVPNTYESVPERPQPETIYATVTKPSKTCE